MTLCIAKHWKQLPMLNFVFFLEKMVYVRWWYQLMNSEATVNTAVGMVTSGKDVLTGSFILLFGLNDLLFALAFGYGAWKSMGQHGNKAD